MAVIAAVALATTGRAADDGSKPADTSKPVKVFILMGQSNMVGMGHISGDKPGTLEHAVKTEKKYPYLVDAEGKWVPRQDVRFVRFMQGKGQMANEWLGIKGGTIGPEFGIGHVVGDAIASPVMLLKTCIGNRSLAWDYLPPGSKRFVEGGKVYAGYKDKPDSWAVDPAKGVATEPPPWINKKTGKPIEWYAGINYDEEVGFVKTVLGDLGKYYPGATKCEIAGFFFWQGEKDTYNAVSAAHYEENLVNFIKALRKDLNCPNAKFVMGTLGEAAKGCGGNEGLVLNANLAVDGTSGKHPEFKGNVAAVYTHDMAQGGNGNSHYGGNAEVYMDVGEAMGKAMVELLKNAK
jgi:hypothetical protein